MSAPYPTGQLVNVGRPEDHCPVCGGADLVFAGHLDADSGFGFALGEVPGTMGIFCCTGVHDAAAAVELELRYADVTPVDAATGHAEGSPTAETAPKTPLPATPYEIAAQYAPVAGPQEQETRRYARPEVREQALRAALTGVQFGGWDERMIAWMTAFDDDICRAVVSWIVRGRQAGPLDGAR